MLTQAFIKDILDYDPLTGIFRWKINRPPRAKIGEIAGSDNGSGYQKISICGKRYYSHRLAFLWMEGRLPKEIDHANQCRSDNRWENLREADRSTNLTNVIGRKNVRMRYGKWYARHAGVHIGVFCTREEAEAAIFGFLDKNFGEFSPKRPRLAPKPAEPGKEKMIHRAFLYKGKNLSQWSKETGIPQPTLHFRIVKMGMDPEEAMEDRRT